MTDSLSTALIWYHGIDSHEQAYKICFSQLQEDSHLHGEFYKRQQDEQTTFMEVYKDIDLPTLKKIEQFMTQQDCFIGINRRCESFKRISMT